MLLISCPNCGPRDETEFHYGGQAHVAYPESPNDLTDREWAEYLFYRENTKGTFAERWVHSTGCRQWFNMLRDTVSYEIHSIYGMGQARPDIPGAGTSKSETTQPGEFTQTGEFGQTEPGLAPGAPTTGVPISGSTAPTSSEGV
ncbi:sarcosine oxidase subunit delta [Paenarthrobacter nicotinovorans]|uniref:sarcosine oxidase subunit delta n=1 Tax=Micrococcaceae TaxID=1268 RepID=UPI0008775397|nr:MULTISPECIES: sarcosine oxidase subunit delta [Micrococcaceae]MDR6438871.1 sarcosine oxidase subunit delta [Paenarthrobacter nicotinovorans]SCZ63125.1 sarcosine oxidase subunit delta [Arthrobacter sp. UNCCL28]